MSKICPKCNHEWPDEFLACPMDGTTLIEKTANPLGFNLNLGDANAISGGVNMSDNHSVSNNTINTSTSTVDSHNVITNHITQVERQKTEGEILQDKKVLFLNACKRVYEDQVLELDELAELENLRIELGLNKEDSDKILESVKNLTLRSARSTELSPMARKRLDMLTKRLRSNDVSALIEQLEAMEALADSYNSEDLQLKYYLVLAALRPEECVAKKRVSRVDNYWQDFWTYIALLKLERFAEASVLLTAIDYKYKSYPSDNATILALIGEYLRGNEQDAKDFLFDLTGNYTVTLQRLVDSISVLLDPVMAAENGATEQSCAFYLTNIFQTEARKHKAEEEARRKAEEETRRIAEEEAKQRALAEVRKREDAENKRKMEAARKKAEEEALAAELAKQPVSRIIVENTAYPLKIGINVIGRFNTANPSDISIFKDDTVSRRSIQIEVARTKDSVTHRMTVLKAENPVKLNEKQVAVGDSVTLSYNDKIILGFTELILKQLK